MVSPFAGPKIKFVIFQCGYLTGKSHKAYLEPSRTSNADFLQK